VKLDFYNLPRESQLFNRAVKVHVTGAGGFVGHALTLALRSAGHVEAGVDDCDAVVHLAAIAHRRATPEELRRVNVELAVQTAKAAAGAGARFVFVSSIKVHGERGERALREDSPIAPQDPYADSKARAEEALRAVPGLRLAIVRPPLAYGPRVKANFFALLRAIARGIPLPLAAVRNRRSMIYVGSLADAIVRLLHHEGTYLVSDGEPCSTPELCRRIGRALGRPARLFPFPAGLLPAKLAGSLEVDDRLIRERLGWRPPYTMDEGLRATAQWYRGL